MDARSKCDSFLKTLGKERVFKMEEYLKEREKDSYVELENIEYFDLVRQHMDHYDDFYTPEDRDTIRKYTGVISRYINSYLRMGWTNEDLGPYNKKLEDKFVEYINQLAEIIDRGEKFNIKFNVYRGVPLSSFSGYGVESLEDLKKLEGNYFYDEAFTSTSTSRKACFFKSEMFSGANCNVLITYHVDGDYNDGFLLGDNTTLSYSPSQMEYVIQKGNLSKVKSVKVDKDSAYVEVYLIPNMIVKGLNRSESKVL